MSDLRLASYLEKQRDRILDDLFGWLRIPSISAQPEHADDVRRSAEYAAALLTAAGLDNVEIVETAGAPAVYGDWLGAGPTAPTALVYGHHDVQPVDPVELWDTPPFEPAIVDGEIRGRGAVDDKGQTMFEIAAVRALARNRCGAADERPIPDRGRRGGREPALRSVAARTLRPAGVRRRRRV